MTDWPHRAPAPQPRTYATPAAAAALLRCPLQAAYRDDPAAAARVPRPPALRIGQAAHRVLERAGAGELPSEEARLAAWEDAIRREAAGAPSGEGSSSGEPTRWPYYALKRARTLRLAARLASARSGEAPPHRPAGLGVSREVQREACEGRLRGRVDVVRPGPPKIIEDYKTGAVSDAGTGDVKQEYRLQMALYAVLEHAHDGVWPERAVLIPLTGPPVEVSVTPAEARGLAQEVLRALDEYRAAAGAGGLEALARPSAGACGFCPFAVHCGPFWSACGEDWAPLGIAAACGVVTDVSSAAGLLTVTLDSAAGSLLGPLTVRGLGPTQLDSLGGLAPGEAIGVAGLRGTPGPGEVWATPSTRVERAGGDALARA